MKKLLITGLGEDATESGIRSWLSDFGSVISIDLIRDGDAHAPLALIEMDITEAQAFYIVSRISNYWHEGSLVSVRLLPH